ncbi:MAG: hypothetical protein JKY65_21545 [Planctomycetes bacterium]|nr:hypothetical protein [Planctomycetota bacterium]
MTECDSTPRKRDVGSDDERGTMLIVALGILALLSLMAITMVKLMNLERKATTNYVDMVKARLIAEGGLERSLAQLKQSISAEQFSDPNARWIYCGGNYSLPLEEASSNPNASRSIRASFWGSVGMSYANGEDSYKVKVVDVQTQFNINQRFDITDVPRQGELDLTYIRFLDSLGVAIGKINPRAGGGTSGGGRNPVKFARYPKGSPNAARGGKAFYLFRESRESGKLTSKQELMEILENEDDYLLLRDYVTAHSWFDEKAVSPRATESKNKPWSDVITREPRSPININLATTEVIAANLAGIAGRAFYVWTGEITTQGLDQNHPDFNYTSQQEETGYEGKGVVVYIDPFGHVPGQKASDDPSIYGAIAFARLIKQRINDSGPFQGYSDWEVFVDSTLTDTYLAGTTDPDRSGVKVYPQPGQANITDLNGNPPRAPVPSAGAIRAERHFSAWFFNAVRSMIKANFNPNARLSSWNPDQTVRLPLDKGGLLWRDPELVNPDDPNKILHQRQTLEWCFAPRGIFEVTALGEVLGAIPIDLKRAQDRDKDGIPDREIFAQAKVRAILQLYNVKSLRTQRDFERRGDIYRDGTDAREDMVSWPVGKIYWDPSVPGAVSDKRLFYDKFETTRGGALFPGRYAGYLSLATRRKFGDIFHTQVIHMGQQAPDIPPKFELLFQDRRIESPGSNKVNIADVLQADTSNGNKNNPQPGSPVTGRVPNRWGWPYGDARGGIYSAARSADVQEAWRFNVLTPDGYLNSIMRPSLLWYRASDNGSEFGGPTEAYDVAAGGNKPSAARRGTSNLFVDSRTDPARSGNVAATPVGAVEFWYKPDFDWMHRKTTMRGGRPQSDPVNANSYNQIYCGLLSTSHVMVNDRAFTHAGASAAGVYSRGTQMFMTRNTEGAVRITRLYFEVVGGTNSAFEVPYVADPVNGQKIKLSKYYEMASKDPAYTWPPKELYENLPQDFLKIRWARSDYWIQPTVFKHWRAGEWHHIGFRWNDHQSYVSGTATSGSSLQVWIDGQTVDVTHHQIGDRYVPVGSYDPTTGSPIPPPPPAPAELPSFVRLNGRSYNPAAKNTERPKDQIIVGAVARDQLSQSAVVKDGVFKHTDDGKVFLPANGTVDDVRFYDGATVIATPTIDYDGRYVDDGVWSGEIDLDPYFPESGTLTLGNLSFTAYLPRAYGVSGAGSQRASHIDYAPGAGTVTVGFEVRDASGNIKFQNPNWRAKFTSNTPKPTSASGFALQNDQGTLVTVDRTDKLVYTVEMKSAKYDAQVGLNNNDQGFNVASPVLDQIEMVYFLPAAKVLLKERVNN